MKIPERVITIRHNLDGTVLFSGKFENEKRAVVEAIKTGVNLSRADLSGTDLFGVNLSRADLSGTDLFGTNLFGANLSETNLFRSNLFGANLYGADLSGTDLSRADLSETNLSGANLSGANLFGANIFRADFSGANLSGANLSGANLFGTDLSGANFAGAEILKGITVIQAPIQVLGLLWTVIIWDSHMQIGGKLHTHDDWQNFTDREWLKMGSKDALMFKKRHLKILISLCKSHSELAEVKTNV